MITIDVDALGIPPGTKPFADGAVGALFYVPNPVPGLEGRTLVFKQAKPQTDLPTGLDRTQVLAQMRDVVAMRDAMTIAEVADLDDVTVWPLAVVRDGGNDDGILLDLIAPEFFVATKPSNGLAGKALFELQFLCTSAGYLDKMGISQSVTGDFVMRLAMAARLAYAIEIVHRHPVVFGDLHAKNAVAATQPFARVLLMDCDSVAELSDSGRVQLHGPCFTPPEIAAKQQKLQDQKTDVYKLGLCIIRILSPGKGGTQQTDPVNPTAIPGLLDHEGITLLRRAAGHARSERPTAAELREYLVRRVYSLVTLPELTSATLSHRVALRGSDIFVRWEQQYGTEVRIFGAGGWLLDGIDPGRHAAGYPIKPPTAGPIDVEVWNKHGPSRRVRAGYLDYYELPTLDIAAQLRGIPRPVISDLPALDAGAFQALQPYPVAIGPDVNLAYPALALDYPATPHGLAPGAPAEAVERAQHRANAAIDQTVGTAMKRLTRVLRGRLDKAPNKGDPK
ncbi:hypothetical protein BJ973_000528 [Actinoplanes tereljensis]|uniref:Protein kinase domain-containing protein n=1 Tax=Paractinoplanes tereljensis TaxID=571912 RepID=A0A919NSE7_9ACTN|nr:hypothetical protein [Actinoplanes tereljensis]GIF23114.1 hypothetical protein Ate02nite_58440 [Actinoplanes tereljensis]